MSGKFRTVTPFMSQGKRNQVLTFLLSFDFPLPSHCIAYWGFLGVSSSSPKCRVDSTTGSMHSSTLSRCSDLGWNTRMPPTPTLCCLSSPNFHSRLTFRRLAVWKRRIWRSIRIARRSSNWLSMESRCSNRAFTSVADPITSSPASCSMVHGQLKRSKTSKILFQKV